MPRKNLEDFMEKAELNHCGLVDISVVAESSLICAESMNKGQSQAEYIVTVLPDGLCLNVQSDKLNGFKDKVANKYNIFTPSIECVQAINDGRAR